MSSPTQNGSAGKPISACLALVQFEGLYLLLVFDVLTGPIVYPLLTFSVISAAILKHLCHGTKKALSL